MKNKKKLIIISIITCVIIMLVGGTLAYFTQSGIGNIDNLATTNNVSLSYNDNKDYMKNDIIPVSNENVKLFATKNALNGYADENICVYTSEYNACSLYQFTITSTANVSQEIKVSMTSMLNEYGNLHLMLYEGEQTKLTSDKLIMDATPIVGTSTINFKKLNITLEPGESKKYTMVIYVKDIGVDQTSQDAGKRFGATMNVYSVTTGTYLRNDLGESAITVDLTDGLTPIVYNDSEKTWEVADISSDWYDYSNQKWANAAILKEGVSTQVGNPINVEEQAYAMYVYIPRYSYTIKYENDIPVGSYVDGIGASTPSTATPGAIDIKFITNDVIEEGTAKYTEGMPSEYRTHPAFTFGDKELNGIWVGKFETSTDKTSECYKNGSDNRTYCSNEDQSPRILPNSVSLRRQRVYYQFVTSRKFTTDSTYGLDANKADSHMMKNSEWGAMAYLTQSIFGKYGNPDYTGANKEIYQNKSEDYITGMSNGTPGSTIYNEQLTYDVSSMRTKTILTKREGTGTNIEVTLNNSNNWTEANGGFKSIPTDDEGTTLSYTFTLEEKGNLDFEWSASTSHEELAMMMYEINGDEVYIGGISRGVDEENLKYDKVHIELEAGSYKITFVYMNRGTSMYPGLPESLDAGYIRNLTVNVGATYTTEEIQTEENGVGASTTGNIYGVYDLSGGAYEYVMAYYTGASSEFGGYINGNYSGFTNATRPEEKYFDNYTSTDRLTACNGKTCYGVGYGETMWWYSDAAVDMMFVTEEAPWGGRGGNYVEASGSGVFYGVSDDGYDDSGSVFRSVLVVTGA